MLITFLRCIVFFSLIFNSVISNAQEYTTNYPSVGYSNCECVVTKVVVGESTTKVFLQFSSSKKEHWISFSEWTVILPYDASLFKDLRQTDLSIPPATSTDPTYVSLWRKLIEKRRDDRIAVAGLFKGKFIRGLGDMKLDTRYSLRSKKDETYEIVLEFGKLQTGVEEIMIAEMVENGFAWSQIRINNPDKSPKSEWTEAKLKGVWDRAGSTGVEGIYENTKIGNTQKYKLALKKVNDDYQLIYLSGISDKYWKEGDVKAYLSKTASPNLYKVKWLMLDKSIEEDLYISFESGSMKILWTDDNKEDLYLKLYPTASSSGFVGASERSGSGFAIAEDGYIVTNHHVVENASNIKIRGINGDYAKTYQAKVVIEDKNNDIAILKVTDNSFTGLSKIPYKLQNVVSEVGTSVYTLGYPLRSTMGDEIKLTNGIISSKSGFQGDITTYQISAPVQPGNSGGPVFDSKGNVIGVISSKHIGAENASYAIKLLYLINLIQSMDVPVKTPQGSILATKQLPEQVKSVKSFIYIIESN